MKGLHNRQKMIVQPRESMEKHLGRAGKVLEEIWKRKRRKEKGRRNVKSGR